MIELTADELAEAEKQMAARPERRTRQQSWAPVEVEPKRIIAIASGKGGVGKSTVTANLAVLAAQRGLKVGVLDADLHGYSLPRLLGVREKATRVSGGTASAPTKVSSGHQINPPEVFGVKVISIGMFTDPQKAVIWRGPVAHRALTQFLTDTDWGPLDLLLIDLPPGTGDIALSIANLLPDAQQLIVTSPQGATAEVAARAGTMAAHTHQKIIGVVENMAWLETEKGEKLEVFGSGGGQVVADQLTETLGYPIELLAQIPLDPAVPVGADQGEPIVIGHPKSAASRAFEALARQLFGL